MLLIKPYKGERGDCELFKMADFLEELAEKPDVRPVMENYINHQLEKESGAISNRVVGATPKNLQVKFIQSIHELLDYPSADNTPLEGELGEFSEYYDGAGLSSKMPSFLQKKTSLLKPQKTGFDTPIGSIDDESTEDSGLMKILPGESKIGFSGFICELSKSQPYPKAT